MSDIIFRLIKDSKVVGYEWHLKQIGSLISIIHCDEYYEDNPSIFNNDEYPIPHDRKDRWTGAGLKNGTKIFENDIVAYCINGEREIIGVIIFNDYKYEVKYNYKYEEQERITYDPLDFVLTWCDVHGIIGIEGVTK